MILNEYYFDNTDNYIPEFEFEMDDFDEYLFGYLRSEEEIEDMLETLRPSERRIYRDILDRVYELRLDLPITDAGYHAYTTRQVLGELYDEDPDIGRPRRWCHLEEIPDSYISDKGEVWSDRMNRYRKHGAIKSKKKRYPIIGTYRKGNFLIHHLLGKYFISNPKQHPIVRHLNDNSEDFSLSNLAWGTQRDNVQDSIRNGTYRAFTRDEINRSAERRSVKVRSINLDTGEEMDHPSITSAARALDVEGSQIGMMLRGRVRRVKNYLFEVIEWVKL